ncbi:MAG TPA: FAD-binding oxidoreductase [Ignavibacteria bacterium]|nr:FAD-binding oxidoreductase [Ignavibacteria bacterium]HMQ98463.1 FAD-binding oxidoreductase [Ignavibacteria bacterium]
MNSMNIRYADAVVIGAGVIGASIAYHLCLNGIRNILVIDGNPEAGIGSTGRATGGYRAQFGSRINVQLSLISRQKLIDFKYEHGIDPGYEPCGYLFLAGNSEEMTSLSLANSLQRSCGLRDAALVSADDIRKLNPHINPENILGGSFCHSDGFIKPMNILKGYINSSKNNGVEFLYNTKVTGINRSPSNIMSIETSIGTIKGDVIVNAAGAWAAEIASLAGETLPVKKLKRQVCRIKEKNTLPQNTPMTIWVDSRFHFRMRDEHLILLMPDEPENNNNLNVEPGWLEKVHAIARQKIPALNNCSIDTAASWAGYYEMSPDEHLILGRAESLNNFYYANGSSGHGVMHSPAIGELLANIICGKKNEVDTDILSPTRFSYGKLIRQIPFF